MTTPSDASLDTHGTRITAPVALPVRPFATSVRRELWENRSIYLAPVIVAAVVLFGSLIVTMGLPRKVRTLATIPPEKQHAALVGTLGMAPAPIMLATFVVGLFYALDALYGERRDRSILFWKSLPVSDRTTVLAKASIPLAVLPLIAYALSVFAQVFLLLFGTLVLTGSGLSPQPLWAEYRFFESLVIMFYGLAVHTLWFAPIYCGLLLISAWARRTPFLWAVLPPLAIGALERIVFGSSHFASWLGYRVTGAMTAAFTKSGANGNVGRVGQLDPLKFLTTPGLWFGLVLAALFLAAAVRIRRRREPI